MSVNNIIKRLVEVSPLGYDERVHFEEVLTEAIKAEEQAQGAASNA